MKIILKLWIFIFLIKISVLSQVEQNSDIISLIKRLESKIDRLEESFKKVDERDQQLVKRFGRLEEKVEHNTRIIYFISKYTMPFGELKYFSRMASWSDAEKECIKWGGHLVTIRSGNNNDYLVKEVTKRKIYSIWIGLTDEREEGKFIWSSEEKADYRNWKKGEPNGGRKENCVEFYLTMGGTWNDIPCGDKKPFVCEKNIPY